MYTNKSTSELLELLEQFQMLTFESQLGLNEVLNSRNLGVDKSALEQSIASKMEEIQNLYYLKDVGFKATSNAGGLTVTRTLNAVVTDIAAIVFGALVFMLGVYGVGSLVSMLVNGEEINVFSLAVNFAMASLVMTGFKFFNGIKRLFDYAGFQVDNMDGKITLKKRFDLQLEEIKQDVSELILENDEDELVLKLGGYTIFSSNTGNLVQRLTMEELIYQLKKV